jgi:hypothetical protein
MLSGGISIYPKIQNYDNQLENSALKETKLLSIGMAKMEQEIQNKVMPLTEENKDRIADETGIQSSLTEDDMKQYLEQVIRELKMQKTSTGTSNNGNI